MFECNFPSGIKNRGFTLIELMITVLIVGILASVAYPSYVEHVNRSRRAEGMAALIQASQQQERYFTTNNTYTVLYSEAKIPLTSEQNNYDITIVADNTSYVITATPKGWEDSKCGKLSINHASVKTTELGSVADCWR